MPTNTIKNESTMEVLPMIAPREKPILPPKVTTAIIISEEITPEISPKVTMIFLISLSNVFYPNLLSDLLSDLLTDLDLSTYVAGPMLMRAQRRATSAGDLDVAGITTIRLSP